MKTLAGILGLVSMVVLSGAAFAQSSYTGTLKFRGGCKVADAGSCILGLTGTSGSFRIFASSSLNGRYVPVSRPFTAPGTKRIANTSLNKCFQARRATGTQRSRTICLPD